MQEEKSTDSLEHIRVGVFSNKDLMTQSALNETFDQMDAEIWECISCLLDMPCKFVEDRLSEVAVRSIAKMTYGRILYNKDLHTDDSWIMMCGTLLHLSGEKKTEANISKIKKLLPNMFWVRAIYEELLEEFVNLSSDYVELCEEEKRALNSVTGLLGSNLNRIMVRKQIIEDAVDLKQHDLLYAIHKVNEHRERYFELRNTIITPFLRLVFAEASKISGPAKAMLAADVFQAGIFGLIRAISTFFKERQAYFSAYARWWVRQSILLSLKEEVSFFKIPSTVWHAYNKLERGEKIEEDSERIRQYVDVIKLVPLEQPIQHDGNTARLLDTLVDVEQEDQHEDRELSQTLLQMMNGLDIDTEKYICLKFGTISYLAGRVDVGQEAILRERIRKTIALMYFGRAQN